MKGVLSQALVLVSVLSVLEGPGLPSALADCREAYGAKVGELAARASGAKSGLVTFAGATGVMAAVAGPGAWIGNGSLAISSGVYYGVLKRGRDAYHDALRLLEESLRGEGAALSSLEARLVKRGSQLERGELASLLVKGNQEDAFCAREGDKVRLLKRPQIEKWAARELGLRHRP